ncbi:uncharacterized protein LOC130657449 [Hydractinia symbiolongicarpus]|uniref:uncharacterized protein LOC130657449 n=1 Tax=Hydractinia symbiolongicarpus TaxID=13093 RepID=UPI002550F478|nr:uncharacterized protein LOC130657449 [Hydractinia symbiolongicarpus]
MALLKYLFVYFTVLLAVSKARRTEINVLEQHGVVIKKVDITKCKVDGNPGNDTVIERCGIIRGSETRISIYLQAIDLKGKNTEKITFSVCGYFFFCIPMSVEEDDFCKSGSKCPLKDNKKILQKLTMSLPINQHYPKMKVTSKVTMKYGDGSTLGAFEVKLRIVD